MEVPGLESLAIRGIIIGLLIGPSLDPNFLGFVG